MSGGSFDYLCNKSGSDLLQHLDMLEAMVNQLERWSPGSHAHVDAAIILARLKRIEEEIGEFPPRALAEVFRVVELAVSNDCSEQDAINAVLKYQERSR